MQDKREEQIVRIYGEMSKEDILLPVEMGKLEIEPAKTNNVTDENPFVTLAQHRRNFSRTFTQNFKCFCSGQKRINMNVAISKKKRNKILKEPVLKLLQSCGKNGSVKDRYHTFNDNVCHCTSLLSVSTENFNLCALVDNCNQLRISSGSNEQSLAVAKLNNDVNWWKKEVSLTKPSKESFVDKSRAGSSCSQQALNPPCDVTIDELASYFETLVHIPKKMSSMAEMMYI